MIIWLINFQSESQYTKSSSYYEIPKELSGCGRRAARAPAAQIVASGGQERGEFGHGHLQLGPPRVRPFVSAQLVANPLVEQVVAAILGRGAFLSFYNGNCNSPHSGRQKLHRDISPWGRAGSSEPLQATVINVNFSTRDICCDNGATEVWPGSHLDGAEPEQRSAQAARRALGFPPIQIEMPMGAVAFRGASCTI